MRKDRGRRFVKISPGKRGSWWVECLEGNYILVGWYKVGDLRRFKSVEQLKDAMQEKEYPRSPSMAWRKARELWIVRGLQAGDRVIANRGNSEILAVGTVQEPGYVWAGQHRVMVDWDTTAKRRIPRQHEWDNVTVKELGAEVARRILGEEARPRSKVSGGGLDSLARGQRAAGFEPDPRIREAIERFAVRCAEAFFRRLGYTTNRVGKPYDLLCHRGNRTLYVEVKGTRSNAEAFLLTRNEVAFARQRKRRRDLALYVRAGVTIKPGKTIVVSGGTKRVCNPWRISREKLKPITYMYSLGRGTLSL
jgi:hypothetical protein